MFRLDKFYAVIICKYWAILWNVRHNAQHMHVQSQKQKSALTSNNYTRLHNPKSKNANDNQHSYRPITNTVPTLTAANESESADDVSLDGSCFSFILRLKPKGSRQIFWFRLFKCTLMAAEMLSCSPVKAKYFSTYLHCICIPVVHWKTSAILNIYKTTIQTLEDQSNSGVGILVDWLFSAV